MKAILNKIKEPLTHDYVIYGLLTLILAIIVVSIHFFYGGFGVLENQFSEGLSNARNSPWLVAGGTLVLTVLCTLFYLRKKNRNRKVERT